MGKGDNNPKNSISNSTLIEGVNTSASFIKNIELKQYKYKGTYIEDLKLDTFQKKDFRLEFFNFLKEQDFEKEEYAQVFFIKLLLVRIQQKDEAILYDILNHIFKDDSLGYYLEDYNINHSLPNALLTNEKTIKNDMGEILKENDDQLLISEQQVDLFSLAALKDKIKKQSVIEVFYAPSFKTGWKEKTAVYYNIYNCINEEILTSLTVEERKYFEENFYPMFQDYIVKNK